MAKKKILSSVLLVVGITIFGLLLYDFGIDNILANIKEIGFWFIPIIATYFVVYLQNAYTWYIILNDKGKNISFWKIFTITISGMAINDITPVVNLGGEPYKIYAIKDSVGTPKAVSSVILYTMIHWLSHFFIWITGIFLLSFTSDLSDSLKYFLAATLVVLVLFIYFFYRRHKKGIFVSFLDKISKVPFLKGLAAKLSKREDSLVAIDEEIKHLYSERPGAFYYSLFLDYAGRLVAAVEFYFILQAVKFDIGFLDAFYIYAGYTLLVNIMFFMPLQLGTREGSLVLVLEILKISQGMGIFVSLVMRIREFFWIFIGLALIQVNRIRNKSNKTVRDFMSMDTIDE